MASSTALWFHVETAFTELHELCVQARAEQLALEQRLAPPALKRPLSRTMASRGTLIIEPAEPVARADPRLAAAADLARDLALREDSPNGPDLVGLRAHLRQRLDWLKKKLGEALNPHDTNAALFPIVVYFDELVYVSSVGEADRWESLQGEIFKADNGGEAFFAELEQRLHEEETHPLVLGIYYYCLSDGYTGAYLRDRKKLDEYKERLASRIDSKPLAPETTPDGPRSMTLVGFPWAYYVIAASVVVLTYLALSLLAPTT